MNCRRGGLATRTRRPGFTIGPTTVYDWDSETGRPPTRPSPGPTTFASLDHRNKPPDPNALGPAAVGDYSAPRRPHALHDFPDPPRRLVLAAFVQVAPESRLRVVSPDVGGGFGSKIFVYAEETAVIWAAGKLRRPVKWRAERSESFLADAHGRDHVTKAELALSADARSSACGSTHRQHGAYSLDLRFGVRTYLYGT